MYGPPMQPPAYLGYAPINPTPVLGGEWHFPDGTWTRELGTYLGVKLPVLPKHVVVRGVPYVTSKPPNKYVTGWTVDLGNGKSVTIEQDDDTSLETVFTQIILVAG